MKVTYGRTSVVKTLRRPKVTLGTFDGVHLGHQRVLRQLLSWARATGGDAVVVTFDRKPRQVLAGKPPEQITSLPHRLLLFERVGLDAALVLEFGQALASMEPEAFVEEILVKRLHAAGVLLGPDTRFGRHGRGDFELLRRMAPEMGFEACSVETFCVDGAPVSSTRIRQAIHKGDLLLAERMLGRRVSVLGTVVSGSGRGRTIGFPTANLDLHHEVRPPDGVYATRTLLGRVQHDSVSNIGRLPTFRPHGKIFANPQVVVENHILDFSGDLYGKELEVQFVERIRSERAFRSPEALAKRIALDVRIARERLAAARLTERPTA